MSPTFSLDQVRIASPCPMRWEDMKGDDRARFCEACGLHVHNLAAMTREQVMDLAHSAAAGRVCARLYRRADGTILTRDCPVGLRRARQRAARFALRAAAVIAFMATAPLVWASGRPHAWSPARLARLEPFASLTELLRPPAPPGPPPPIARQPKIMGSICFAPSP